MKGLKKAMVRCFGMRAHAHRRFHELVNRIPNNETIAATKLAAAAAAATATATTTTTARRPNGLRVAYWIEPTQC